MTWTPSISSCDQYLNDRSGRYEFRAVRYRAAIDWMLSVGLTDGMTVVDIGAGMTELIYCLIKEYDWQGRYIGVDGGFDGTDLNYWSPPRNAHFFVMLEILEHLQDPFRLLKECIDKASIGVVASTPNPRTTDVISMDNTHVTAIDAADLEGFGMSVKEHMFYGGAFSNGRPDSLFCTWENLPTLHHDLSIVNGLPTSHK